MFLGLQHQTLKEKFAISIKSDCFQNSHDIIIILILITGPTGMAKFIMH
jgi:hypothetical protein